MPTIPLEALDTFDRMDARTAYARVPDAAPVPSVIGNTMTAPLYPPRTFRGKPMTVTGAVVAAHSGALVLVTPGGYFSVRAFEAVPS